MKFFLCFTLLYSCSQALTRNNSRPPPEGWVSGSTALQHAKISYMKGCVDTFKYLKIPSSFNYCRDQAENHEREIDLIIEQMTQAETPISP
jgi:hypothetical protein